MNDGFALAADEASRRIGIINKWYAPWMGKMWEKIKVQRSDVAGRILEAGERIDMTFDNYRNGKTKWEDVEKAIDDYAETWRMVPVIFPK